MQLLQMPVPVKLWQVFIATPLMGYAVGNIAAKLI
jgi:hypothetical protein